MITRKELQSLKGLLKRDFTIEAIGPNKNIIFLCPMFDEDFERLKRALDEFDGLLHEC